MMASCGSGVWAPDPELSPFICIQSVEGMGQGYGWGQVQKYRNIFRMFSFFKRTLSLFWEWSFKKKTCMSLYFMPSFRVVNT